ncbi:MAG: hypothetical protein A2912_03115 [Candidatus Buchananbacteria bacterium RIFCSPLOWO2_01_FULL_40_23b]|uniref:GIY-YIG domain-containing protein n=1 Tax=Candidatus Buchananbacteria bacterium RIFCSPLOWO2_01_FULL_40_23b TaxID=1797544 RepID=A0A1G1YUL2_9BACT|nr:MAG: hypothetical protein A2912_03115 [Candidatus Buchananbacteria bacterium RIFCSPLOWO2_01_FULL_40_23b]
MYYVYFLKSKVKSKIYVGCTADLKKRFTKHNHGKVQLTKAFAPWNIVYYEAHLSKTLARITELFYKSSQGRRQIKKKLGMK